MHKAQLGCNNCAAQTPKESVSVFHKLSVLSELLVLEFEHSDIVRVWHPTVPQCLLEEKNNLICKNLRFFMQLTRG